jgi:2',3'-cyclic-nucleotide 2'-phosphodiesterase (5'-nucleotidase family)
VTKETRAQSDDVLLLDGGNALWGSQPLAVQSEGKVIIEAMNLMGYDAMVIGDQDLQWGAEVLRQRIADADFPVLSANLKSAGEDALFAAPYTLLEVGGHTVGLIGLTWEQTRVAPEEFVLLNAEQALRTYVPEVAEKADIIIVLSNMGHEDDLSLAAKVPGIDLIVGSRTRIALPEALLDPTNGTLVVQAGSLGQWLGRITLHFDSLGVVTGHDDELLLLTEDLADDPETRAFLDNYATQ